ncbi:MAG: type II toxin-antitoxin system VapC family toxin [Treponema sp.]|jgi:predicted nucleic acid-binding protein|nr:type II toxin-antitoxin system VapC family toxin [Treponema sp.]
MVYLCDTNILIEYLRGNTQIRDKLLIDKPGGLSISTISLMELLLGANNQNEIRRIKKTFKDYHVIEIDETISTLTRNLIESYSKSHNLQIPDAFIAATSITRKLPLFTLNVSDFNYLPQIKLITE